MFLPKQTSCYPVRKKNIIQVWKARRPSILGSAEEVGFGLYRAGNLTPMVIVDKWSMEETKVTMGTAHQER